ncbi:MAG: hypothetical protein HY078_16995 [Elusimicrobia bacterium]|nr:hypothetical protein [Elusimicrobiota bacterium]
MEGLLIAALLLASPARADVWTSVGMPRMESRRITGAAADDRVAIGRLLSGVKSSVSKGQWDDLFGQFGCSAEQTSAAAADKPAAIAALLNYRPPGPPGRAVTEQDLREIRAVDFGSPQAAPAEAGQQPQAYSVPGKAILAGSRPMDIAVNVQKADGRVGLTCPLPAGGPR